MKLSLTWMYIQHHLNGKPSTSSETPACNFFVLNSSLSQLKRDRTAINIDHCNIISCSRLLLILRVIAPKPHDLNVSAPRFDVEICSGVKPLGRFDNKVKSASSRRASVNAVASGAP